MEYRLDYIQVLAEERNMTRAAERLFVSQPTLTKYINRLESELGVKLFDRAAHPIRITTAGVIFMEDMKTIQEKESAMHAKLDSIGRKSRTLILGIGSTRSMFAIPRVMPQFLQKYPDVEVNSAPLLEQTGMEKALLFGELDAAVGVFSQAYNKLDYECIQEEKILLLIPRAWLPQLSETEGTFAQPFLLDQAVLSDKRLLILKEGGGQHQAAQMMLERYGIEPAMVYRASNPITIYQLTAAGVGYMFTTPREFVVKFPEESRRICFCRLGDICPTQKSYFVCRKDSIGSPMLQYLKELLIESYAKE